LLNKFSLIFQHPNFFGVLEEAEKLRELTEKVNALLIVSFDPISLGLLKPPGEYGADIAVGEGQPLGLPLGFGGPYLGLFTAKKEYLRQMPGRIAGATLDAEGKRGYVMALQTREQHIRREKATSNICTNQMLCALAALVYMATMGKEGIKEVALQSLEKSHYMAEKLKEIPGVKLVFESPFFKEFLISFDGKSAREIRDKALNEGYLIGLPLDYFGFPEDYLLVAVTEKRTREEIDGAIEVIKRVLS